VSNEDKAHEAVEHLQAAALEMIAAARAVLDIAEELVQDPGPLLSVVAALGEVAGPLVHRARQAADADEAPPRAPRVQHIRVS
jgi:hypothetical protein